MPTMALKEYTAAGGVVIHEGRILVLDRPSRNEVRLPKGHIDPGELPEETAIRETEEESGYGDLEIVAPLGTQFVEFDLKGHHYRRTEHYFLMRPRSLAVSPRSKHDAQQFFPQWLPAAEAISLLTFSGEQEMAYRGLVAAGLDEEASNV
jgi:8-oxo-dGTP pyrophosphatase MutT (NUDIX family)